MTLIYVTLALPVLIAFASLAVDVGRLSLVRSELRCAADAAARHGASGLLQNPATARAQAIAAAAENRADGSAVVVRAADVQLGQWVASTRQFTALPDTSSTINAVRVTVRRNKARNNQTTLGLAAVLGFGSAESAVSSTAIYNRREVIDTPVNAAANPWLAGEPVGTLDNTNLYSANVRRDRAGSYTDANGVFHKDGESPTQMTAVDLEAGEALSFDAIAGTASHGATQTVSGPDGNPDKVQVPWAGAHLGKSSIRAPIDSVVAVFLTDAAPTNATPPAMLDFGTAAARDFTSLAPKVGQVFFIGDGMTSGGVKQSFIVPPGATRLFIAKMDGTEWNNNVGTSTVTTHRPARVTIVR